LTLNASPISDSGLESGPGERVPTAGPTPGRFQFGLRGLFALMTGAAVACGLIASDPLFGGWAAVLLVGSWWSRAAMRGGHRKLAYYLATVPMGVGVTFVVIVPLGLLLVGRPFFNPPGPLALMTGAMCLSVSLTAAWLRRPIRERVLRPPGEIGSVVVLVLKARVSQPGASLKAVYICAVLFVWLIAMAMLSAELLSILASPRRSVDAFAGAVIVSLIVMAGATIMGMVAATLTLPVSLPLAWCFCSILARIDRPPRQLTVEHRWVVVAVEQLRRKSADRVADRDVAARLRLDMKTAMRLIDELLEVGMLRYRLDRGLYVASPQPAPRAWPDAPTAGAAPDD
jgi:MFS family permease